MADNASLQFGGEAALPLHYFRTLRRRGVETWLVTHERVESEIRALFPRDADRVLFARDTPEQIVLWKLGRLLPQSASYLTTGFVSRLLTQIEQRRIARRLIAEYKISIIHQPTPVSPLEPSVFYDLGAPVIIGPMNGGMCYPPGMMGRREWLDDAFVRFFRPAARILNRLLPGKRRACRLLVANRRTRDALPAGHSEDVRELVENGVDLSIWSYLPRSHRSLSRPFTVACIGRLISLKRIDIAMKAIAKLARDLPCQLRIIGDGPEKARLRYLATELSGNAPTYREPLFRFEGWMPQSQVSVVLNDVDAVGLPSIRECGGAVVLEAMAAGVPVVATRWGGPADYLDNECGILVEPSSEQALVAGFYDALRTIAEDPARAAQMGMRARHKAETQFDWERKCDLIVSHYLECIDRN